MERNSEFSPYSQFEGMDNGINDMYKDPMFNPIMQYEQAYSYYKYLCMQMDYKLKCKEYEKMCAESK
ncbi:MAG: hypothetical protein IJE59_00340 [Clostridia bacterium]|nr:hypothetical protein [Clostridia bacterium]